MTNATTRWLRRLLTGGVLAGQLAGVLHSPPPPTAPPPTSPPVTADPRAQPGGWATRLTAGSAALTDALGRSWSPATGLAGGAAVPVYGGIAGTASESLYKVARQGPTSWAVQVPVGARYAVDLLVADATGAAAGDRVFDVRWSDGSGPSRTLAAGVDIVALHRGWWAGHVTGTVPVTSGRLVLTFVPVRGQALVSGLAVTSQGPIGSEATTYAEDFSAAAGTAPPAAWNQRTGSGPWGSGELEAYTGSRGNSAQGGGSLQLTARRESWSDAYGTRGYTSARLDTKGQVEFTYGHVEARMSLPAGKGLWPAFWSLGSTIDAVDWPVCGELDITEVLGDRPGTTYGTLHGLGDAADPVGWRGRHVSSAGGSYDAGSALTGWHTYAMDVTPDFVSFGVDGQVFATVARADLRPAQAWPVGHRYYLVLDLAVGGDWPGAPDASTPFPATLAVDRVSVAG